MISVIPLTEEHIKMLVDPITEPGIKAMVDDTVQYWSSIISSGTAFAGFDGDLFIGCAGYAIRWKGVCEVWFWANPSVHKRPVGTHKVISRALRYLENDLKMHRISCEVRKGNDRAVRWVTLLGFKYETTMRKRGPDKSDFLLYSRTEG